VQKLIKAFLLLISIFFNLESLSKTWALQIVDKILKGLSFDFKTRRRIRDQLQRFVCKTARDLRNTYCDSLTGKSNKDKTKDDEDREKDKDDKKKEEQKK
jgi:hypothetical protein